MKKKILLISNIILIVITFICITLLIMKTSDNKVSTETTFTKQEGIIAQNNIDTVATSIPTEDEVNKDTEEKNTEEIKQETKENNDATQEKNQIATKDKFSKLFQKTFIDIGF